MTPIVKLTNIKYERYHAARLSQLPNIKDWRGS